MKFKSYKEYSTPRLVDSTTNRISVTYLQFFATESILAKTGLINQRQTY